MHAESSPGHGNCIRVLLPRAAAGKRPEGTREPLPELPRLGRSAVALVVEDQPAILRTIARALTQAGLSVLEAASGEDALVALERHGRLPELVVADVVLPRMSGVRLASELRERDPRLKVLFVSGYGGDELTTIRTDRDTAFIAKPFTGNQLASRAIALLTAADEASAASETRQPERERGGTS
jgi:two-component system cell cycle sensor histidine kinase/response regulator CckA